MKNHLCSRYGSPFTTREEQALESTPTASWNLNLSKTITARAAPRPTQRIRSLRATQSDAIISLKRESRSKVRLFMGFGGFSGAVEFGGVSKSFECGGIEISLGRIAAVDWVDLADVIEAGDCGHCGGG
ncbi:hypothetical protein MRB53_033271 [Persea americana]|uniref:Uncharacterized protein n=1 Tax=Persea americana TaxID=3435 RepID=A0ACC2KV60_PERAE|nr:hypothetical protein MRB53_033271 [Persea americana]